MNRVMTRSMSEAEKKINDIIDVIVEIPYGEEIKYEWDPVLGRMRADRRLTNTAPMMYPGNYGFIPDTLSGDGDPTDAIILVDYPFAQGSVVSCRVLGALKTTDEKGQDEKILLVPVLENNRQWSDFTDIDPNTLVKIRYFFEHYKDNDKDKFVEIDGFVDKLKALDIISKSRQ